MRSRRKYRAWYLWGSFVLILAGALYLGLRNQPKYVPSSDFSPHDISKPADFEAQLNQNMDLLKNRTPTAEELNRVYQFIQASRRNPSAYSRSRELRLMLDLLEELHAAHAVADQLELLRIAEEAGNKALEEANYEEAVLQLTKAVEIQTELNNLYRVSPPRNHARLGRMESQILHARVQPLLNKSKDFEEKGDAALEAKEWQQAVPLYREAYRLQQQINQLFRGSRYSSHYRARQLQDRVNLVEAGLLYEDAQKWIHSAEESAAEGKIVDASNMYREAERELLKLIEKYPANPFVNRSGLREILRNRENLEAFPQVRKILSDMEEIREQLRQGNVSSVQDRLPDIYAELEGFFSRYPDSNLISADLRYQIQYLFNARSRLAELSKMVADYVRVKGENGEGIHWSEEPVSQDIYQRIMRSSGGNVQNQSLPVSQVTYNEASEFCRRLSAVSGHRVRLPSTGEYQELLENQTNPSSGFSQLPDGWAEWSWDEDGPKVVAISPLSASVRPVGTRSAQIGFRFLLQNDTEK